MKAELKAKLIKVFLKEFIRNFPYWKNIFFKVISLLSHNLGDLNLSEPKKILSNVLKILKRPDKMKIGTRIFKLLSKELSFREWCEVIRFVAQLIRTKIYQQRRPS